MPRGRRCGCPPTARAAAAPVRHSCSSEVPRSERAGHSRCRPSSIRAVARPAPATAPARAKSRGPAERRVRASVRACALPLPPPLSLACAPYTHLIGSLGFEPRPWRTAAMLSACPPPSGTRIGLPHTPPSLPSSPWELSPHAHTAPSTSRARECSLPAAIWVHRLGSSACPASWAISGPPHPSWPRLLLPHDSTCHQAPRPPSDDVSAACARACKAQV